MIESKVTSKTLKKKIIHNYNYLINKKNNVIVKIYMDKIAVFKKGQDIFIFNTWLAFKGNFMISTKVLL